MRTDGPFLVVGGSGQIGEQILRSLRQRGLDAIGTYHQNPEPGLLLLDASDREQSRQVAGEVRPVAIINASNAKGGTDACEVDPSLAERYHFGNARNLADAAGEYGARFVQIS